MDGYGFAGGHILILMINCFHKAGSGRHVTFVSIYALYAKVEMVYSYKAYYV